MLGCSKDDIITPNPIETIVGYKNQTTNSIRLQSKVWQWYNENTSFYADINLDGKEEVFIANENSKPIVMWNDNTSTTISDGLNIFPRSIIGNDFNGDGYIDFVVMVHNNEQLQPNPGEIPNLYLNDKKGGFIVSKLNLKSAFWHLGSSADIDKDGDIDLVVCTAGSVNIMINDGKGGFTLDNSRIPSTYTNSHYIGGMLEDINGDGYIDLLVYGAEFNSLPNNTGFGKDNPSKTRILWGNSSFSYTEANSMILPNDSDGFGLIIDAVCVDLNDDGKKEIILDRTGDPLNFTFYKGYKIQILTEGNDVTNNFISNASSKTDDWIVWLKVMDVNGDYKKDVLEGNKRRVKYFLQK
jgi:hypothetical protein